MVHKISKLIHTYVCGARLNCLCTKKYTKHTHILVKYTQGFSSSYYQKKKCMYISRTYVFNRMTSIRHIRPQKALFYVFLGTHLRALANI